MPSIDSMDTRVAIVEVRLTELERRIFDRLDQEEQQRESLRNQVEDMRDDFTGTMRELNASIEKVRLVTEKVNRQILQGFALLSGVVGTVGVFWALVTNWPSLLNILGR